MQMLLLKNDSGASEVRLSGSFSADQGKRELAVVHQTAKDECSFDVAPGFSSDAEVARSQKSKPCRPGSIDEAKTACGAAGDEG